MSTKNKSATIAVAIILVALSFWGGTLYAQHKAKSSASSRGAGFNGGTFTRSGGAGGQYGGIAARGGGGVSGTIISMDATSATIQLPTGGSKIVFFTDSTDVGKSVSGTKTDLAVGEQVSAVGTPNQDGSITAQSIQIRPAVSTPKQ
jgi:hypothetical protein